VSAAREREFRLRRTFEVLVADDEPASLKVVAATLRQQGLSVDTAMSGSEALKLALEKEYDLVLTDERMPGLTGTELLKGLREKGVASPVIVMTAYGGVAAAVEAMRCGAYNYLTKPLNFEELILLARQALEAFDNTRRLERLSREIEERYEYHNVLGRSPAMRRLVRTLENVAATDATVLLLGETGTGKELIARAIHYASRRRKADFVAMDCSAVAKTLLESELFGHEKGAFTGADQRRIGCFERAHGGTLFLDEIANLPYDPQATLLRVLQEREFRRLGGKEMVKVDVRVIAATNVELTQAVQQHTFREDLYYRLNVVAITLPPLRERLEDVPQLAGHFLAASVRRHGRDGLQLSSEALSRLMTHSWPGNVRELENVIERSVILSAGPVIGADDLGLPRAGAAGPTETYPVGPYHEAKARLLDGFDVSYLRWLLAQTGGRLGDAARLSGLNEKTLYEKLHQHGIRREDFKPNGSKPE
jgi:DNA-binding NtrC family response regulator